MLEIVRCLSRGLAVSRQFDLALTFSTYCRDLAIKVGGTRYSGGLAAHAYCLIQADKNTAALKVCFQYHQRRNIKLFNTDVQTSPD